MQTATTPLFLLILWAICLWFTRPNHSTRSFGGIDLINTGIAWTAFTAIFGALASINWMFSRQLFSEAKGDRRGVKTW